MKLGRLTRRKSLRSFGGLSGATERGVVGDRGVADDAEVVLDPPLRRQAVVVPAHGVEDVLAAHPSVAGDRVGVGVAEHVADVQRARCGRRGRVDREDLVAVLGGAEAERSLLVPHGDPALLEPVHRGLLGDRTTGTGGGRQCWHTEAKLPGRQLRSEAGSPGTGSGPTTRDVAEMAANESDGSAAAAIVTGAGGGIGGAVARRLAADGFSLVLADRDPASLERVVGTLPAGTVCELVVGDVASKDAPRRAGRRGRGPGWSRRSACSTPVCR